MHKSGIVAISGKPNVGKSTILNGFLKEKIAIISRKPETTRDNIRGILTEKDCQIVFLDTPGIHKPHDLLGRIMLNKAMSSLMEADIVLFVTEKRTAFDREDENILSGLPDPKQGKKVILVINKTDRLKEKRLLLPLMEKASGLYPFNEIVPLCALKQKDIDALLGITKSYLPEGPVLYPDGDITDRDDVFLMREIIREKILELTRKEIPHSAAVSIDEVVEEKRGVLSIYATIFVERASQKSIIIGRDGAVMKRVGELARKDIEKLLSRHVYLNLWVKVYEKWKKDPAALRELGYSD